MQAIAVCVVRQPAGGFRIIASGRELAEKARHGRVLEDDFPAPVEQADGDRHMLEGGGEQILALPQGRLRLLARGDVGADRHVLLGLPRFVDEGNDGRIDPVERAVLGAVANLAAPDFAAGDGAPQVAKKRLWMVAGIDDAMGLAKQILARIFRDGAEFIVDVGYDSPRVGDHDDGVFVEGRLEDADFLERGAQPGFGSPVFGYIGFNPVPQDGPVRLPSWARAEPYPARFAIRSPHGNFQLEVRHVAGASKSGLGELSAVFERNLAMQDVRIGKDVGDRDAVQPLDAGADIKKPRPPLGIEDIAEDGVTGQVVAQHPQGFLALAQGLLGALPPGDVLRGDDDAADVAAPVAPWAGFPPDPLHGAIGADESLAIGAFDRARHAAPVHVPPRFADFGKDFVMTSTDRRAFETVVAEPALARGQIAHVTVEHGGGVFDEERRQPAVGATLPRPSVGDIADHSGQFASGIAFTVNVTVELDPALGPVIRPADPVDEIERGRSLRSERRRVSGSELRDVLGVHETQENLRRDVRLRRQAENGFGLARPTQRAAPIRNPAVRPMFDRQQGRSRLRFQVKRCPHHTTAPTRPVQRDRTPCFS